MKPILPFIAIPLLAVTALAATTVQTVTEVSAQQAIIRYRTTLSPATSCSWAITETVSGATPDDVNTSIFSGSNLDTRPGSIVNGPDRAFVFGQRTSALGLDGLLHSRSLKANYAYTATVTCGADSPVTVYFNTGNIQLGGTYSEQPPFNSAGFGNWGWPGINWGNQAVEYPDPQTGVVIKRATSPGWLGQQTPMENFDFAIGGSGWTNPQSILNGSTCSGTSATCAQSANSNSIFLSINGRNLSPVYSPNIFSAGFWPQVGYDDWLLSLRGIASVAGAQPVGVCISFYDSGATCNSATQTVDLSTGSATTVGFPAASSGVLSGAPIWSPQFNAGEWGGPTMHKNDFGFAFGCPTLCPDAGYGTNHYAGAGVTTSGTAVAVACSAGGGNSESCFNPKWNNSYIYIQGSGCTDGGADVCQVNGHPADTEHLTLKNAPATTCSSPCNWASLAAGFKITPSGAGTVDIGAQYAYATSPMFQILSEGDFQVCNPVPVSVGYQADGTTPISPPVPGELCFAQLQTNSNVSEVGGQLFLLIPSTGETRYLSPLYAPPGVDSGDLSGDRNSAQIQFTPNGWDGVSGLCMYGLAATNTSGRTSIFKACYGTSNNWKAYAHPLWAPAGFLPGENPATGNRWSDDPMTYTNISPPSMNLDIYTQMAANNPQYDTAAFPTCSLDRVVAGYLFVYCSTGQNTWAVISSFSLVSGHNTGNGNTFTDYPNRNCGYHSSFASYSTGNYAEACDPPGEAGGYTATSQTGVGPFQITPHSMLKSAVFNTDTSMSTSAPADSCPSNPYGITGNNCVTFRTQDMCSHFPGTREAAKWPCPLSASWSQPITFQAGDAITIPSNENLQAISVTPVTDAGCGSDCIQIVAGRGMWNTGLQTQSAGWTGYMIAPFGTPCDLANCGGGYALWTSAATTGPFVWAGDPVGFGHHGDAGTAPGSGNLTLISSSCISIFLPYCAHSSRYNNTLANLLGSWNQTLYGQGGFVGAFLISSAPPFGGVISQSSTNQSYPSNEQIHAVNAWEKTWATDNKAINGGSTVGPENFIETEPVAYTLVGGTSTVYKFTAITGLITPNEANYKLFGLIGNADRYLLQDVSGPASSLSDSAEFQVCMALAAGECHAGSSAGQVYETVPNVPSIQSYCIAPWLTENYPCAGFKAPLQAWLHQFSVSQSYYGGEYNRRITLGLNGHYRQYGASTFIPEVTGTWAFFKADWADGIRSELFMTKFPPFPGGNSIPRNTFVNYSIQVPGGGAYAEIKFGYMENGSAQAYFCTNRQDPCTTSGSPFAYPSIDGRTLLACSSGCTVNIPAIAGRAVYYSIGFSANGATWTYGAPGVGLVQ